MGAALSNIVKVRRSYRCPGVIGAHLLPRSRPGIRPRTTGDCIMLDFENRFFGISDSSNRNPAASREFLVRFQRLLFSIAHCDEEVENFGSKELRKWGHDLTDKTNSLLLDLKGIGSCTFTGLHLVNTINGLAAVLLHTGDSALYEFLPSRQKLFQRTENNFWMVGRTDKLYQTEILESVAESIFIMTTDGIGDLHDASNSMPKEKIKSILYQNAVEEIPAKLIANKGFNTGLYDDAAVVALAPQQLKASKRTRTILME